MSGSLDGKVAIITGAAKGQGLSAARIFAEEGARVAMLDVDDAALAAATAQIGSPRVRVFACNVAYADSVQTVVKAVADQFGQIDVLYKNAGTNFRCFGPRDDSQDGGTHEVTEQLWDLSTRVNRKSVFLIGKHVLPYILERRQGSIINVSSVAGPFTGAPNHVYATAKAGIVGLTKALAQTYGPDGVRANVIAPGVVATTMMDRVLNDPAAKESVENRNPLRRLGEPEDIARVALFLAADDSAYVTGSTIVADGGYLVF
ncbi:SDR family NAD(P)-dependent oxidoreductase [Arthrobacter bambusae]|uniref:SDR family NAD(P)-dependent oxidoreductase n=1 Tax=Arthrobacter bambusae TaxID=1338426 RepID=UPI002785147B|nr:SDR family NAD(P)-dependent oxidoreductase [Arthrobacter bambusae]MDQ0029050.1 3-oxoacyl-[acyl-carrier protein] reductase [Arthrobacter bambusae]MDQ0098548.1 3-oxoacyl-[acyl-carrier protein] reductase [Arthrobacter bambusae]